MNLARCFELTGRQAEIHCGESVTPVHAIISPLRYKNKMYLDGVYTEIGFNSEGHYLYIGPAEPDLTALDGAYVSADGVKYRIDRAEKVYRGSSPFYVWAVIRVIVEPE